MTIEGDANWHMGAKCVSFEDVRHAIKTATTLRLSGERLLLSGGTTLDGEDLGVIAIFIRGDHLDVIALE